MSKKLVIACTTAILSCLTAGMASAGVPCAGTTSVVATGSDAQCTPGAAVCPAGDYHTVSVQVTVRDCYGTPLAGETVTVTPAGVTGKFCFCDTSKVIGPTDALGQATAYYTYFGGCGDLTFYATIQTVTAGPSAAITIGSPDNNGDCVVNLVDFGNFASDFLTTSSCSDYNCDDIVDLVDFGNFASHFLHICP